ncbi:MAG: WecB/TagA/CpsF family glycosyltransferase [Candidatus Omnitrophota bacterium]
MAQEYVDILGVKISSVDIPAACAHIFRWIEQKNKTYVCIAPVSTVVRCQEDEQYRSIINGAAMVTPDGMPLVWLGRLKGHKTIKRTYGPDLMLETCRLSQERNCAHYFYGGSQETCDLLEKNLRQKFPKINIAGKYSPPFRNLSFEEDKAIVEEINRCSPDILWVGLGSPKQDIWMSEHRLRLNVPVMVGVGAAFDFIAGTKSQAPIWMQNSGLEWIFRLCCEPGRLWRRYLIGNSKFIFYLLKDLVLGVSPKK